MIKLEPLSREFQLDVGQGLSENGYCSGACFVFVENVVVGLLS